jgi:hypothetical protein
LATEELKQRFSIMKTINHKLIATGLLILLTFACTKKTPAPTTDSNGLPLATQTGKNTFGCLIDGVPVSVYGAYNWLYGNGVKYYFGLDSTFQITAISDQFRIDIIAKVSGTIPGNYSANKYIKISYSYADFTKGGMPFGNDYFNATDSLPGSILITKYSGDRINGGKENDGAITSGTFDIVMLNSSGKKIHLTAGRFDIAR